MLCPTRKANDQWIRKIMDMTTCFPNFAGAYNAGIQKSDVIMSAHCIHPCINNIFSQQNSIMTKIIRTGKSAVNLRTGKDESSPLAQRNDFFHKVRDFFCHESILLYYYVIAN